VVLSATGGARNFGGDQVETNAQLEISRELAAGERLLWSGRPYQGLFLLHPFDAFLIPFGLLWTVGMIGAMAGAPRSPAPADIFGLVFLSIFVAVGLYMVFGRFLVDARQRQRIFYGLTDQRVIIIRGVFRREIRSINLKTMIDLSLSERRDKTGTIRFGGSDLLWHVAGMEWFWPGIVGSNSFMRIPNAREVYDQIRAAQSKAA